MGLKGRIDADLKTALLSRDAFMAELLRGLKSAILYQEVALKKRETGLSDTEIEQVLAKEAKKRIEAAELFEKGGNQEAADKERREKIVIEQYLPKRVDEAEVERIVEETIATTNASGPAAMGQVIGAAKAQLGTSADGALIAKIAKQKLNL